MSMCVCFNYILKFTNRRGAARIDANPLGFGVFRERCLRAAFASRSRASACA